MKFTCDSCSAQYMISDEKVGPTGVKVRCKKCGNVVLVRRAPEETPTVAPAATPRPAPAGGPGLDVELGNAFDNVFREPPAEASAAPSGPDAPAPAATGGEDEARASTPAAATADSGEPGEPAATEWYVAIGQAQVGPLPLAEVKRKWEAGDVGPDSLVWRPGMTDWRPLTTVPELAGYLAPVPRSSAQPARAEPRAAAAREPQGAARARTSAAAAPSGDVSWKPAGASALAALASEEIAARNPPEKASNAPAASAAGAGGVKSLVDGLPDGGGVDPTGALPLSIKALEATGEKKLERRSTIAHRAQETRHRRSVTRAVVIAVVLVALVGSAAAGALWYLSQERGSRATVAAAPATAPSPPPAVTPPATPPVAPEPAAAAAIPNPPPPALPPPPAVAATEPPAEPPAANAEPAKPARTEPVRTAKRERSRREPAPERVAVAPPPPSAPAPTPAPAPPPARKKGLLDFETSDSALDDALGGSGTGRTVYVPPPRAGNGALPDKLSPAQINEAVATRIDPLRRCVSEQKERDPGATGVLKMRWVINGEGGVRDVKCLTPEYAQGPFAQCITGVVKTIKFPRSATTGQEVTFPFQF